MLASSASYTLEILRHAPKGEERVVQEYDHSNPFGKRVRRYLRKWSPNLPLEPKGLRRTLTTTARRNAWNDIFIQRFIGHSPRSITDRDYIGGDDEDWEDSFRGEIIDKIDDMLSPWLF